MTPIDYWGEGSASTAIDAFVQCNKIDVSSVATVVLFRFTREIVIIFCHGYPLAIYNS